MRRIPLTQGKYALVDDKDYIWLSQWKWFAAKTKAGVFYAQRTARKCGKNVTIRMHRELMDMLLTDNAPSVDHINGNTLDNRRCNLRAVSAKQNQWNGWRRKGKSKYKGVTACTETRRRGQWCARIECNGRRIHLGRFISEKTAAEAYNVAAKEMFGQYANLNDTGE